MYSEKQEPFLYFNFKNNDGKPNPLQFSNPIQIFHTRKLDEVIPCLKAVDQAINNGYYAAGYISYEATPAFKGTTVKNKEVELPLLWFGIFNEPIEQELSTSGEFEIGQWKSTVPIKDYYKNVDKIHKYIKNKQTEQVNYTIRLESDFSGHPISFYHQLERAQSANYSAYLDIGDFSILSASPELFFHIKNGKITTRPMKGTIDRGKTYAEDIEHAKWLRASKKNQLENQLIIDLMSNELKEIAIPNTIDIPELYTIEKYPTVFQMTSTITANIRPEIDFTHIFKALFPCGSITGIPKKDTIDIISKLEKDPREIYCGAIGWIAPNKEATFNVPIRTVCIDKKKKKASYGVGGAITKDSTKEDEYEEVMIKARLLTKKEADFKLLESLGLIDGKYLVYQEHLNRLKQSADFFDFEYNLDKIKDALDKLTQKYPTGQWKVRLILFKNSKFSIEIDMLKNLPDAITSRLSKDFICKDHLFLYHKTTNRAIYNKQKNQYPELFDVLLWNENQEITEFTMGNIVVQLNDELYTPPVESGLLAGTFRESLLKKGVISERKIMINELALCQKVWFINSVRGWVSVKILP